MANTEISNMNRSVRSAGENKPSLGCGYTRVRPGETAIGDFVAIMALDATAVAMEGIIGGATGLMTFGGGSDHGDKNQARVKKAYKFMATKAKDIISKIN